MSYANKWMDIFDSATSAHDELARILCEMLDEDEVRKHYENNYQEYLGYIHDQLSDCVLPHLENIVDADNDKE